MANSFVGLEADEKMRWKVRPVAPPALCPRDVDVEDTERDREALSPVDDPRQVGVLHVVVGLAIAPRGSMDRRVRAVALHKHLGGAVDVEIGEHEPLKRP